MTSYRADKVKFTDRQTDGRTNRRTDGETQATTISRRPERPRGNNTFQIVKIKLKYHRMYQDIYNYICENTTLSKNQSYRLLWGAASPILNDTPCLCIYTSYNQNSHKDCICIDKYIST